MSALAQESSMATSKRVDAALRVGMIDVQGTQLRTATRPGSGDRPPLMLLNGIGARLEALGGFVEALNPDIGVILFDTPGVGGSPKPSRPFRFGDLADVMANLLDQLDYAECDVFGVSWGGALAQEFAHKQSDRCRRLVLGSTSPTSMVMPSNPMAMMTMMNPMRFLEKDYLKNNAMRMYGGKLRDNPQLLGKSTDHMMGGGMSMGPMYQMLALMGWSSVHWLHEILQPTLIIAGKDDPIVPPVNAQTIARRIPNSRLELVDCGHLFFLTMPAEIAAMVDEFLGEAQ
jgi:poly(3-hydroxyoctanoate) depolymerase